MIPPYTSYRSIHLHLFYLAPPSSRARAYRNIFFLAYRAPQRAAIPLQKMRTSKVGADPTRGRNLLGDLGSSEAPSLPVPQNWDWGLFTPQEKAWHQSAFPQCCWTRLLFLNSEPGRADLEFSQGAGLREPFLLPIMMQQARTGGFSSP